MFKILGRSRFVDLVKLLDQPHSVICQVTYVIRDMHYVLSPLEPVFKSCCIEIKNMRSVLYLHSNEFILKRIELLKTA